MVNRIVVLLAILLAPIHILSQKRQDKKCQDEDLKDVMKWAVVQLKLTSYGGLEIGQNAYKVNFDLKKVTVFDVLDTCFQLHKKLKYRFYQNNLIIEKKSARQNGAGLNIYLKT